MTHIHDGSVLQSATLGDFETLVAFGREFYQHFGYPYVESEKRNSILTILKTPSVGRLWLIRGKQGEPVGYLYLAFYFSIENGGRTAFVDELFVQEAYRSAGLGSRALQEILKEAAEMGLGVVQLEVERLNVRAAALYKRLGFVDHERGLLTRRLKGV
jgi:ribosomal protein S18 acetylase RimI-like enzyme